jgi:xylulokinase
VTVSVGLDIGTSGARAVAVDEAGRAVASAASPYPLLTPRPQWAEQDPEQWWRAARAVLAEVIARVAAVAAVAGDGGAVAAIGLTGQMHGAVFLDAKGEVIRPALLWNDQRTGRQSAWITERVGRDRLIKITGNPALTGFQAPKVIWLRDEEPASYRRLAHVLLPKDYVRYRLTGELATDASDAAGTLLLDLRARNWSAELCDALDVDAGWLPRVHESPEPAGVVRPAVAAALGLPAGVPVAAGGGDNAAAAIGTGITRDGVVSSSIGTSGVVFAHTDAPVIDAAGGVHAFCHAVPGAYCLLGVTLSAGGSLRWWRDVTGRSYAELAEEAAAIPAGSEGLLFLPYLTGERSPHADPDARGAFFGLTARHTRGHMTRALMEGVLFSLRQALEAIVALGVRPAEIRATGGGSGSPLWRRLQADVYRMPVRRLAVDEGAAYGAALLGHVAGGILADVGQAAALARPVTDADEPEPANEAVYEGLYAVYRDLYRVTAQDMHRLSRLGR